MAVEDDWSAIVGDLPLQSETGGFAPEQMTYCRACQRTNPPTRTSCLYCGAELEISDSLACVQMPTLRPLEKWECGFNLILTLEKMPDMTEALLRAMTTLLRLSLADVQRIFRAQSALPLARTATRNEAALIKRTLDEFQISSIIVRDDEVEQAASLKRARALSFTEKELTVHFVDGELLSFKFEDIMLLIAGRIIKRTVEIEERNKRGAEKELVDMREISADESLLDIHTVTGGWRVTAGHFDFSCLGEKKTLLVAQNYASLGELLRARATFAWYDDSYNSLRRALDIVWPCEQEAKTRGLRRERPGKFNTEAVITSDNEMQFTRYSRLQHYLKLASLKSNAQ